MYSSDSPAPAATGRGIVPAQREERRPFHATRWANALAGLLYIGLFLHIYRTYISQVWGYTGLYYSELSTWEIAFVFVSTAVVSFCIPTNLNKPSSIIIWLLYAFVFIPTIAITFMIGGNPSEFYVSSLLALAGAIALCSLLTSGNEPTSVEKGPGDSFVQFMIGGFCIMAITLFITFRNILSFASIDDIYVQRFAAAEIGNGLVGYFRTYFSYVFSPTLIAIGLVSRRRSLVLAGVAGYILSYAIDAAKIALVIPATIFIFVGARFLRITSTSIYTFGIAVFAGVTSLFTEYSAAVRYFVDVLLLRTITIPGQTFSQYYDLFEERGYTYWSNTRFIDLVVPPPVAFRSDPFWPVLGQIVGAEYYGADSRMNANANLFAGEGVAAGGPLGVIVIALLLAGWLRMMDRYSQDWNRTFVITIVIPVGMALTNIHLTTLLLSFGGLFWLVAFRFGIAKAGRAL